MRAFCALYRLFIGLFGLVPGILHRQVGPQPVVPRVVGALGRRGRGDGGDLADALGAVGKGQQLLLFHIDRVDGGDAVGAQTLGRFSQKIKCVPYELLCVVNFNRPETNTPQKAEAYLRQIEYSARLTATGLVNNTHLDHETTTQDILRGAELSEELSTLSGVPVIYHAFEERFSGRLNLPPDKQFAMQLYMRKPWEL